MTGKEENEWQTIGLLVGGVFISHIEQTPKTDTGNPPNNRNSGGLVDINGIPLEKLFFSSILMNECNYRKDFRVKIDVRKKEFDEDEEE